MKKRQFLSVLEVFWGGFEVFLGWILVFLGMFLGRRRGGSGFWAAAGFATGGEVLWVFGAYSQFLGMEGMVDRINLVSIVSIFL